MDLRTAVTLKFLKQALLITFVFVLQSCFETKNESAEKIAPTPTNSVHALAIGGDIPQDPVPEWDCVFNGTTVTNGDSVTAFQNSSVGYGEQCVSETRICREAVLSGTYTYGTCAVGAPRACLFDGQTVGHGDSITAYTTSSVAFGRSCTDVAQMRTCNDGALSGNAQFAVCREDEPRACLFDGRTLMHGETVQAFDSSTTQYGGECRSETRQCNDGTLSGAFAYSSCAVDQPASCLFDGQTITHGSSVVAFENSRAEFGLSCRSETRVCTNGQLSGVYANSSCVVNEPANCQFNGNTVTHGESIVAYNVAQATAEMSCLSEVRSCLNGALSGSFMNGSCAALPPPVEPPQDPPVDPNPPTDPPPVPPVDPNPPTDPPVPPVDPNPPVPPVDPVPAACKINGKEISSGSSITLFVSSRVTAPAVCTTETRVCTNGVLSGIATAETCEQVQPPTPPVDPNPPTDPPVPPVDPNPPTPPVCSLDGMIWELPNECNERCSSPISFLKSRISRDGGKTWLVIKTNKLPDDLAAIWNYMIKKHGRNSCDRPNVKYSVSPRNRAMLVMDSKVIPSCDVCKFREYQVQVEEYTAHMCSHQKRRVTKTVVKFTCEEPKKVCDHRECPRDRCEHKKCDHKNHNHCEKNGCDHKNHCDKKSCDHKNKTCDYKKDKKSCDHKSCSTRTCNYKGQNQRHDDRGLLSWLKW